jgi:diketogulonate reductase-like aldo/keto reductase
MRYEQEKPMPARTLSNEGVPVPRFLYGTAWKDDETRRLTALALREGFRGINTANQRRHYHEAAVGQAIAAWVAGGLGSREDLFLQTKFTFRRGQDDRLPYDPEAHIAVQVEQSFASSLAHLGTDAIDSYLLHGPSRRVGLGPADGEAWRAMEPLHAGGRAWLLGVSNVSLEQLQALCRQARVRPRFVQNRCHAARGWDRPPGAGRGAGGGGLSLARWRGDSICAAQGAVSGGLAPPGSPRQTNPSLAH